MQVGAAQTARHPRNDQWPHQPGAVAHPHRQVGHPGIVQFPHDPGIGHQIVGEHRQVRGGGAGVGAHGVADPGAGAAQRRDEQIGQGSVAVHPDRRRAGGRRNRGDQAGADQMGHQPGHHLGIGTGAERQQVGHRGGTLQGAKQVSDGGGGQARRRVHDHGAPRIPAHLHRAVGAGQDGGGRVQRVSRHPSTLSCRPGREPGYPQGISGREARPGCRAPRRLSGCRARGRRSPLRERCPFRWCRRRSCGR